MSNRKAWRVANTTSGEPDFDSFAEITLIVPAKIWSNLKQEWPMKSKLLRKSRYVSLVSGKI